ncbi:MAG TPA: M23 family metallopeptidase, partial [Halanaerobiales bacterium]|nr:M23 family metallopeptidase [Halanaerobiales bacterium]
MDKKYWFKLDKDKIKLQLKSLGRKFTGKRNNTKILVLVLLFFILLGAGYSVYRNDLGKLNTEEEAGTININPFEESAGYSLDYEPLAEDRRTELAENIQVQETEAVIRDIDESINQEEERTVIVEEIIEEETIYGEEIEDVITEGVRAVETGINLSFSLLRPMSGEIIQETGWYYHPVLEDWRYRHGIELSGNEGDIVMAAEKGRVISVQEDDYNGIMVSIEHENGWQTSYGHLQKAVVNNGQSIARGQEIGR